MFLAVSESCRGVVIGWGRRPSGARQQEAVRGGARRRLAATDRCRAAVSARAGAASPATCRKSPRQLVESCPGHPNEFHKILGEFIPAVL